MSEMIRTQIYLSPEQHEKLKAHSKKSKKTMAFLIREAVDTYLIEEGKQPIFPADDPLFDLIGSADSGPEDVSANHDQYLYKDPHR